MDKKELERVAYAMERAYKNCNTLAEATHEVADQFPDFPFTDGILSGMWMAIDAYVDINE